MRWQDVAEIVLQRPEVADGASNCEASLKVRKRLLTRARLEDKGIVHSDVPPQEREFLIEESPQTFFLDGHYRSHRIMLARPEIISSCEVETIFERRWRSSAKERAIAAFDRERV